MESVQISNELSKISELKYDKTGKVLEVHFRDGRAYRYFDLEENHFNGMKKLVSEQKSVGKYLTDNVFNKYDQEKISK